MSNIKGIYCERGKIEAIFYTGSGSFLECAAEGGGGGSYDPIADLCYNIFGYDSKI